MKKIKETFTILIKTINLLWASSKSLLILTITMSLIAGAMTPIGTLVWKNIIDIISNLLIGGSNFKNLYFWLGIFFLTNLIMKIISSISEYITIMFSEHLDMNIKEIILTKINQFSLADFDNSELYNEISKASNESTTKSLLTLQTLLQMIRYGTSLIGTLILLLTFNTAIVILCLVSTIPMFYISCKIMDKFYEIFNRRYEKLRFSKNIEGLLIKNENIKEIKIYRLGNYLKEKILKVYRDNLSEDKYIRAKVTVQNVFANSLSLIFEILIKALTIFISIDLKLTIGTVSMYLSSIDNLTLSISNFLSLISSMYENSLYMKSIFNLLEMKTEKQGNVELNKEIHEIEFRNVSFHYPGNSKYVLKNINLKLSANKTYALVGYNGAGKTTLIKLLLGLYKPTEGQIFLDGINLNEYDKESIYKQVDAVFQDFIKYPFDIKSNIGIGCLEHIADIDKIKLAAYNANILEYIEQLPKGFNSQLSREWSDSTDLSLGQWQKIAIARAMMKESSILVLDEPTASIDIVSEHEIFKKFETLKQNRLCILVTHRLSNVRLADRIFVLDNHEIIDEGTHEELLKKGGLYKELYNLQADMFASDKLK